jgi:threonine aldolase
LGRQVLFAWYQMKTINLYSDTQSTPGPGMRAAMAQAQVGDEQRFQDPVVAELQRRVCDLLGFESAVFLPTGTMCNAICVRVHTDSAGDEIICDQTAHPVALEAGGPAAMSGASLQTLAGNGGIFGPEALAQAIRPQSRYAPRSRLVIVEQTTNLGGGRIWPLNTVREVLSVARSHSMRCHLDGARLLNACVATGVSPREYAEGFDTAWIDFTKGLGAPVGAVLAASQQLIDQVWRYKQMFGGAMRQAGVLAAACLYALDNNVQRLADDHANAALLARGLSGIPGVYVDPELVETNIVIFEVGDAASVGEALRALGVEASVVGRNRLRMVTHLDIDQSAVERAIQAVSSAVGNPDSA